MKLLKTGIGSIIFLIFLSLFLFSCQQPKYSCDTQDCNKIDVGEGPEDFALDTTSYLHHRMIISSAKRRNDGAGKIEMLNIKSGIVREMKRFGEDQDYFFSPHGIFFQQTGQEHFLWVISHEPNDQEWVLKYIVRSDSLIFQESFQHPLFKSLNGIAALEDGRFFVSNDNALGGSILICSPDGACEKIAKGLMFANGLHVEGDFLYAATTLGNRVLQFNLKKEFEKKKVTRIKGGDNFSFYNGRLILAAHPSYFRFFRHVMNSSKRSPTRIYSIDPLSGDQKLLFEDDGRIISAGATALIYRDDLYISQVFEPYLLKVSMKE
ncbi:MAG: hypothetical protein ACOC2E_07005 [Bacteroidota bacterium]